MRWKRASAWSKGKEKVVGMGVWSKTSACAVEGSRRALATASALLNRFAKSTKGQGTTEYAILVGVLVVIAILAITVFRPKLQELWNAISDGINSL